MNLTYKQHNSGTNTYKYKHQTHLNFGTNAPQSPHFLGFLQPVLGAYGTFMGIFNKVQINKLQVEMWDVQMKHNRLVKVVANQGHHIQHINQTIDGLIGALNILAIHDPAITSSQLSYIKCQIKEWIQTAVHIIQQAQHRHLAVNFLDHVQLCQLYKCLQA